MKLDVENIRKDFPMLQDKTMQGHKLVFLDNASTTFKPYKVIKAIERYYMEETSNSHRGDYDLCSKMDQEVDLTRKAVAKFVNCDVREVVFTSGDSMSINTIAYGYGLKYLKENDEILLSEAEHASNMLPWFKIAKLTGAKVKFIPLTKEGRITPENVKKSLTDKTRICAIAHVGNVLGYIADVKEIARVCHEKKCIVAIDGAQSVPHMPTNFKDWDIDFLSFSGHKMCGPTGIGVLIGKFEILDSCDPFMYGGGMNQTFNACGNMEVSETPTKFEAGTLPLAEIIGLRAAIEYLSDLGMENIMNYEHEMKNYMIEQMSKLDDVIIYNKDSDNGIVIFNIKNVFAQDEATLLNSKGICVRSGQHCAKMLVDFLKTVATLRASIYFYTTKEEIDEFIKVLSEKGDILDAYFN